MAPMGSDISVNLSLFGKQGHERGTADFYKAAFGAEEINCYELLNLLTVELRLGHTGIFVCGSDPKREVTPTYGGPYHPKAAGAVSAIFQLTVPDVEASVEAAIAAGARIRDKVQSDLHDRRVASIFDPAGHVWVLIERAENHKKIAA